MRKAFFTSASFAYLDRARVLFETIRKYHPEWEIWLCLVDEEPDGFIFDVTSEDIDHVVRATELGIEDFRSWAFQHDVVELCTAVKGSMSCLMLDQGIDIVVYLDPDIALFSELKELEPLLELHSALLTPHQLQPDQEKRAIIDNEIGSLKYGIYNLGFLALKNCDDGKRLAKWWRDRLLDYCFDDVPNGLFTDQKWFNHAPVFFPTTGTLRHSGYNVASWNLSTRPISIDRSGVIFAGRDTLRFVHFTKISTAGAIMFERYSEGKLDALELLAWYRRRLKDRAETNVPQGWWAFSRYADGRLITKADRLAHRLARAEGRALVDPFSSQQPIAGQA